MVTELKNPASPVDIILTDKEVTSIKRIVNAVDLLREANFVEEISESSVTEMSLSAEFVVMKYLKAVTLLEIVICGGKLPDKFIHKGKSIKIQCRSAVGLAFLAPYSSQSWFNVDYGILVYRINDNKYTIHGVISGSMFRKEHIVKEHAGIKLEVCGPESFSDIALIR